MIAADITIDDFKTYFVRDFRYASNTPGVAADSVMDADITKSFAEALVNFNDGLFATDSARKMAFLQLAAHFLTTDLQAAAQGSGSTSLFPVVSRTAGPLSETYNVPLWLQHDPVLSAYATTRYGIKYVMIVKPLLVGGIMVIKGDTTSA